MTRVAIVGGGITGLSAAYYLSKAGAGVTLIEQRSRLGGVIETRTIEGCIVECGPDSFLSAKPASVELIREIGLGDEVIGSNDRERITYILRRGRLVPLPEGLMMMVPTRIGPMLATSLLSWATKIRMGLEYFRRPGAAPGDRSVSEFIRDHYGQETVDYLAEPLLSGVYGGDPAKLSAASVLPRFVELEQKYGSLTRGVLKGRTPAHGAPAAPLFRTLKSGLGTLVKRLEERARPRVIRGEAETIQQGRVRVNGEWIDADHVVLACPAWSAAKLVAALDGELARGLAEIEYNSSIILALGYRSSETGHLPKGFGFLVPQRERKYLGAVTFTGTKFAHRTSEGIEVLRCFFGSTGNERLFEESDESMLSIAQEELSRILCLKAKPVFHTSARWPHSMAQYTVGHAPRVRAIEARAAAIRGLHMAGNAYSGIGIPDCIRTAREAATRILAGATQQVG